MTRDQAYDLMCEMIQSPNLRKHGLAVEAIMRALCKELKKRHPELQKSHPEASSEGPTRSRTQNASAHRRSLDSSASLQNDNRGQNDDADEFDEEEWAIVGLLHDGDYELIEKDPARHTLVTEEKLRPFGVSERIINGIKAHHDGIKQGRDNYLERSVYAADELSGLITACALVKDKKLANVTVETVMKKFPEKSFAAGARRDQILACERELDIKLDEFVAVALKSMQEIAPELGL